MKSEQNCSQPVLRGDNFRHFRTATHLAKPRAPRLESAAPPANEHHQFRTPNSHQPADTMPGRGPDIGQRKKRVVSDAEKGQRAAGRARKKKEEERRGLARRRCDIDRAARDEAEEGPAERRQEEALGAAMQAVPAEWS